MLKFMEFQWAAFLYWVVSYRGNIGGDQDYVPLMSNAASLERLRNTPSELNTREISDHVILFLNQWKCMVKDDGRGKDSTMAGNVFGQIQDAADGLSSYFLT